jgi:hypothetical protein
LITTNYKASIMTGSDLLSFLRDINCNSMQFEMLRYVGRHPRAKLSFYVIAKALGTASTELGDALMALIQKDMLVAQLDDNGVTTYSLSAGRKICNRVCELAALDWSEAMSLKRKLIKE